MKTKLKKAAQDQNLDTARKLKDVLAQLSAKSVVIAMVESDTVAGRYYDIVLTASNAVLCRCKGWQFSKTGTCKHLERFRTSVKPSVFPKQ